MTQQQAFSIASATIGFVAACCFIAGSVFMPLDDILNVSTPRWDNNQFIAQSLIDQKAQYLAGALLLLFSFCLQIASVLTKTAMM